jgi:hypothetical protein
MVGFVTDCIVNTIKIKKSSLMRIIDILPKMEFYIYVQSLPILSKIHF